MSKPTDTQPKQDELRNKLKALKRPTMQDFRYPIEAYEDDLVALINSESLALLERLDSRCQICGGKRFYTNDGEEDEQFCNDLLHDVIDEERNIILGEEGKKS